MIPIKDNIPSRSFPISNWLLIGLNIASFLFLLSLGSAGAQQWIDKWGLTPRQLVSNLNGYNLVTVLTSMFLHGGWAHLLSNMLALFIFGDGVEDRMGHLNYLIFYLMCGGVAAAAQIFANPFSTAPMVGASGAISGVLAAYLLLYPRARILTLFLLFFLPWFIEIPAVIYLGFWFISQLCNGLASIGTQSSVMGGVAYWAHIGGFTAGVLFLGVFTKRRRRY